ncbi:hypothetical protein D9756_004427 [Leucocoprinus leucothites]|uniref:pyranose dehydrogenase (acceptor) n=1 Tax=Leucocoprinus leucothites TaxID=201217 RepID=A0A8H5G8M0_9AGAR|nr:hypothetical protein D9756_004427 [Leucoagaricus leucothites]
MAIILKLQLLLCCIFLSLQVSRGRVVFQNVEDLPQDIQYDFIVAGGGTGGSLVATRLAENTNWKILVIEAGGSNEDAWQTRVPALWQSLWKSRVDWNYTTVPQPGLNNRAVDYPRGKVLGGCSSHNTMIYTRGAKSEWDRYAELGVKSWEREQSTNIRGIGRGVDSGPGNLSDAGHFDPAFHGTDGELSLSEEFPFNQDWNDGTPVGTAWNEFTIDVKGMRSSATTAFLSKAGDNVHVLLNTYVTRVVPAASNGTDFRVVEVGTKEGGELKQIVANKEVIVSGGIFGTPQILLYSGIGNGEELEAAGVQTLVDNPSVGKNLSDQVTVFVSFSTTIDDTVMERNRNRTSCKVIPLNHMSFIRLPDDAPPFSEEGFSDTTTGEDASHVEFSFFQIGAPDPDAGVMNSTLQVFVSNIHPVSRGSVTISTSNPFDYAAVDPGLLAEPVDMSILREAIRSLRRLLSAPVFQGSVFGSVVPPANVTSDEDLEGFVRNAANSWLHGVGSASMSPKGAEWGVVDPDFRVKGTTGLRVVDASVVPFAPTAHTQAQTYGFAELASLLIAKDYA